MTSQDLRSILSPYLVRREGGGAAFEAVSDQGLAHLAHRTGGSLKSAAVACLEKNIWPERYRAQRGTFSAKDQAQLLKSTVAVIGAGGLGGAICIYLARTGVGGVIVCDGDVFDESNLNRQLLCRLDRIGQNKAVCAAQEMASINPLVEVMVHSVPAHAGNIAGILKPAGLVIDGLDHLESRFMVQKAARDVGIPFIHGALAGREGMVLTVFPEDPGLEALYGEVAPSKEHGAETVLGTPTITPAVVAGLQVEQALQIILGRPPSARRRLLHLNLDSPGIEAMTIE